MENVVTMDDATDPTPSIARSEEDRNQIALAVCSMIDSGRAATNALPPIWEKVERYHLNKNNNQAGYGKSDMTPIHRPLLQPRLDQLNATVCSVILDQDPYVLFTCGNDQIATLKESIVQRFWYQGGFDNAVRQATILASDTNRAIFRITWGLQMKGFFEEGLGNVTGKMNTTMQYGGIVVDAIHPVDFIIAPGAAKDIESAACVGHRFYRSQEYIIERQRKGIYFDDFVPSAEANPLQSLPSQGGTAGNINLDNVKYNFVELYEVIVRLEPSEGKDMKPYIALISYTDRKLLRLQEYPYSRPWYWEAGYLEETESFWGDGKSTGRNLHPLQEEYNNYATLAYNGAMFSALPPIYGPRIEDGKYESTGPGQYITVEADAKIQQADFRYDGSSIRANMLDIERAADTVVRVSTNNTGGEDPASTTATQTQAIQSSVQVGQSAFIACFSRHFGSMAEFTCELLADHYTEWAVRAPDLSLQINPDQLRTPGNWEPNGKAPSDTPVAKMMSLQQITQLYKQLGPASGINPYRLTQLAISLLKIPGSDGIQDEQPQQIPGQDPNQGRGGASPNQQGSQGNPGVPDKPQDAGGGGPLPPLPATTGRPAFDPNGTGSNQTNQ